MSSTTFSLIDALSAEVFYQTEGIFYKPLFDFEAKIGSLHRFYILTLAVSRKYQAESLASLTIETAKKRDAELLDVHHDITSNDLEYFGKFVFSSSLTHLFSAYESLLQELIEEVREKVKVDAPLSKDNIPLVNRYIKWLKDYGGCKVELSKESNCVFDILREIRNRFIHGKCGDFPEQMRNKLLELRATALEQGAGEEEYLVFLAFRVIGQSAKQVELAFLRQMNT
jgi:hypothetical protein